MESTDSSSSPLLSSHEHEPVSTLAKRVRSVKSGSGGDTNLRDDDDDDDLPPLLDPSVDTSTTITTTSSSTNSSTSLIHSHGVTSSSSSSATSSSSRSSSSSSCGPSCSCVTVNKLPTRLQRHRCCFATTIKYTADFTQPKPKTSSSAVSSSSSLSSSSSSSSSSLEVWHRLRSQFVGQQMDESTMDFLLECCEAYHGRCSYNNFATGILKPLLSKFFSHTDLNGLLATGQMFLLSTQHFQRLLLHRNCNPSSSLSSSSSNVQFNRVLDIGAGSGFVTQFIAPLFKQVVATEVSPKMVNRLKARGYTAYLASDIDSIPVGEGFDVVTLFNVIDRCHRPRTLLKSIHRLVGESGRLVVATPLPLEPSVEENGKWLSPVENIRQRDKSACRCWECSVVHLVTTVLQPAGFEVESFSRLPYLSQGDNRKPFYVLDDVVMVLKPAHSQRVTLMTWMWSDRFSDSFQSNMWKYSRSRVTSL